MLTDEDLREVLQHVVSEVLEDAERVEWLEPGRGWSAHVRLRGVSGLVGHLLTSLEWQEARFEDPHCDTFMITVGDDADEVRTALTRLAHAVSTYVSGGGHVEEERKLFGSRMVLVLPTDEGTWRVGPRMTRQPSFPD